MSTSNQANPDTAPIGRTCAERPGLIVVPSSDDVRVCCEYQYKTNRHDVRLGRVGAGSQTRSNTTARVQTADESKKRCSP